MFFQIFTAVILATSCICFSAEKENELITWKSCKLVATEWADGDSFQIQTPAGELHTIRLYGVDCIEWHVSDDTDARRLREQRRYFGISNVGGSAAESINTAKLFGEEAAIEVRKLLRAPFSVHTYMADGRGDGRFKRIYAFVTLPDGDDLAERLVRTGFARAMGVTRATPSGKSSDDYKEFLKDTELQAAKKGLGVWAKTNWYQLALERQLERRENEELGLAAGPAKLTEGEKINPNTAARDDLMKLPKIREVMANRIIEGRPYKKIDDLLNVEGIGPATLEAIKPHLTLTIKE